MTHTIVPDATTHRTTVAEPYAPPRALGVVGGISSILAPLLFAAGAATSPPQADGSPSAYIASLAADPTLSGISANFFHYSWVLFAFAAVAAIGLVRGRRGRLLTTIGGLAGAFGAIQFTGLLYSDWVLATLGNELSAADALAVFEGVNGAPSVSLWLISAQVLGLMGFPLLYAGLARAGVIGWWLVPLSLLPMVAFGVVGGLLGVVLAVALYAPSYVVGLRLLQRARLTS